MKFFSKLINVICLRGCSKSSPEEMGVPANILNEAVDRVVNGVEPKLRYFPGYNNILNNSVAISLAYISKLVDTLPEPISISSKTFGTDPQVKAFFVNIAEIHDTVGGNAALRGFFDAPENCELCEAYAFLCMKESEKTVLGMALRGDVIQRDVMQTAVDFSDHKIMSPAKSDDEVRDAIKQCIFDAMITHTLQQIVEFKQQIQGLEIQRDILKSRLKTRLKIRQTQGDGLSRLLADTTAATTVSKSKSSAKIEQQMVENTKRLGKLPASWEAPRFYVEMIKNIFAHPESYVRVKAKSFKISNTGIVCGEKSSQSASSIHFKEILIADVLERVVTIVRYPRNEMLPRKEFKLTL